MGASRCRPGRSPARGSDDGERAAIKEEDLHHHGPLGHSLKTVRHYRDTSRLFNLLLAGKGYAIRREAGLEVFHPHQVRHTTATNLLAGGADTHSVRRMLGHAPVLTAERYLSMAAADLKAKHAAASPYERVSSRNEQVPIRGRRRLKVS